MLKIFVTGDNHIGKKYDRYPDVREKLIQSRFESMRAMVRQAEQEGCGLFAVTGDLFDNISTVKAGDVKQAAEILAEFSGTVLVLPGNHDYYTGDERVWKEFEKAGIEDLMPRPVLILFQIGIRDMRMSHQPYVHRNIPQLFLRHKEILFLPVRCDPFNRAVGETNMECVILGDLCLSDPGKIIFPGMLCMTKRRIYHYPLIADLKGIFSEYIEKYNIVGVTLQGFLKFLPYPLVTHIPYPDLEENEDRTGHKIFNPGTHEQTDLHNNTEGCCFVISLEKSDGKTIVSAHKFISGRVRYYDLALDIRAAEKDSLQKKLENATAGLRPNAVVRVKITGTAKQDEYEERARIYQTALGRFLTYETDDYELSPEITVERIRSEFSELSFAAQFMERFLDEPTELQMAYELIRQCRDE